jgi:hypothetical protein
METWQTRNLEMTILDSWHWNWKNLVFFKKHLKVDEQVIPYYGRRGCKIFIRGKAYQIRLQTAVALVVRGITQSTWTCARERRAVQKTLQSHWYEQFWGKWNVCPTVSCSVHGQLLHFAWSLGFRTGTVREVSLKKCPSEEMKVSDKYERGSHCHKCDL